MLEIRFHGRGGQGAVIASEVLAHAFFKDGQYVQAFPQFGVERRGAPVAAFCRADDSPILLRSQVYTPDHLIVLDASLLLSPQILTGLKPGGLVLINTSAPLDTQRGSVSKDFKVAVIDASAIAVEFGLGSAANPIVNTAILGAFARVSGAVRLESVTAAISQEVPVKPEQNMAAAQAAFAAAAAE